MYLDITRTGLYASIKKGWTLNIIWNFRGHRWIEVFYGSMDKYWSFPSQEKRLKQDESV